MSRPINLTFEEWVEFSFARPREPDVFKRDYLGDPPAAILAYLTRAFENAGTVFAPIPDTQLADAFWHADDQLLKMHDPHLPGEDRARAIRSILSLFRQVFAVRCADHLCHLDRAGDPDTPDYDTYLNGICYMWWDVNTFGAREDDPVREAIDSAILDVLEGTLALDSIACQESALHGLGHAISWQDYLSGKDGKPRVRSDAEGRARAIIDAYLARNSGLIPELKEYALAAKEGGIQ